MTVIAPNAPGALPREEMDGVRVCRYRYAPSKLETLVNDGGIVTNLRSDRWKWALVPGFLLGQIWSTWRAIVRERPDVIHAHWLLPQGLVLAVIGVFVRIPPWLVTSHGADLFSLRGTFMAALKRFVVRQATAVTVVSTAMRHEMERLGISPGRVSVQPMGVDVSSRFTPDARVRRSSDEILFVGRMVEKKGLRQLIEAMPLILAACPSAHLTVVGFGPEEPDRRAQAAALGLDDKVCFMGARSQDQLPELYRRAAVFVAPFIEASHGDQEGFGLVLVEALGCGCPVVAGTVPAVMDILGGHPGSCVDATDHQTLAGVVVDVLSNPHQAREKAIRMRVALARQVDWDSVAKHYAEVLDASADLEDSPSGLRP